MSIGAGRPAGRSPIAFTSVWHLANHDIKAVFLPFGADVGDISILNDEFKHSPRTLLHIAAELREAGVSPVEIFRRLEISAAELLVHDRWLPRALCFALGEEASTVSNDPFFGSRIGERYEFDELGLWGETIARSETVRDACSVAARGIELLHEGTDLRLLPKGQYLQLRFAFRGRARINPRQHIIGTLAVLRKIALLGNTPDAIKVRFSIPYSPGAECLEKTHGSYLEFGCDHDAVLIDRDISGFRLDKGEAIQRTTSELPKTAEDVGALIRQLLPYGRANIQTVAGRLDVSKRTLQRRMKEWGFAFEELLDEIRRTEALDLVCSGERSAIEISFLLGYSDPAHFTRAFRRWTGVSPREYARQRASVRFEKQVDLFSDAR